MAEERRAGRRSGGRAARSEERREAILRAALAVIAERGYRGASLSAVAERAGLTQQGLLHYFPTKEALLVAVLEARDEWDTGGATRRGQEGAWPLDLYAALIDYNAMRPGVVQTFSALLGESVTEDHRAQEFFRHRYELVRETAAASLRGEFGERLPGGTPTTPGNGSGNGLTPEQVAPLLIAVMDGLQFQWLLDPGSVDMPAAFRAFLSLLRGQPSADRP